MERNDWKVLKLGDFCDLKAGKNVKVSEIKQECDEINKYPCYGGNGIRGYIKKYSHCLIYPIIGRQGALCGNVTLAKAPFYATEHAVVVKPRSETNITWLYYKLRSLNLNQYAQGVAQPGLAVSTLNKIPIPVPPLPVQARIVDELDCLQGILSKKRQQLAEYHSLAQAIFHQMFGDPVVNEKGWEVKRLGEVFDVFSGGTPSTKQNSYWENGIIPWIGSNMCRNEIIKEGDGKFITQEGLNNSSAKIFSSGYVLVALVGATIGKTALLKFDTSTNQNVAGINVPQNKNYTSEFIFFLLQNLYCLFENISKGKFKMANLTFVRNLPIIAPPLPLQHSFANRIAVINNQCESLNKSIHEMETLLATRMDKLLNMDC